MMSTQTAENPTATPREVVDRAKTIRFPVFKRETSSREKVTALEDHVCGTAFWQGELEAARIDVLDELRGIQDEWDELEGWEILRQGKTDQSIEEAKRKLKPELYKQLRDQRWWAKRLAEQIERMEREFTKASRLYTFLMGS